MRLVDRLIFGGGRGLALPHFDQRLYWLVDANTRRGDFYTFFPGFGAQLLSFQWTHPRAQETRILSGVCFRPFQSHRRWFRVNVAWALTSKATNENLRKLEARLGTVALDRWEP